MPKQKSASDRLREWMTKERVTQAQFARDIERHDSFVSHLLAGRRLPSLRLAATIERHTGIPSSAWAASPPEKRAA